MGATWRTQLADGPKLAGGEGTNTVIPPSSGGDDEDGWGTNTVSAGLSLDLDAAILVDRMTRALLTHHREAILSGQRPDGKGPQKPLSSQALAAPGRQSDHRGYRTGVLADGLRRTKIEGDRQNATSRIVPPTNRNVYVANELRNGVSILTLAGKAGEVAREAAGEAVAEITTGKRIEKSKTELEADEAGKK